MIVWHLCKAFSEKLYKTQLIYLKKISFAVPINHQKMNSIKLEKRNFSFSMRSKIIQGQVLCTENIVMYMILNFCQQILLNITKCPFRYAYMSNVLICLNHEHI